MSHTVYDPELTREQRRAIASAHFAGYKYALVGRYWVRVHDGSPVPTAVPAAYGPRLSESGWDANGAPV